MQERIPRISASKKMDVQGLGASGFSLLSLRKNMEGVPKNATRDAGVERTNQARTLVSKKEKQTARLASRSLGILHPEVCTSP